MAAPKLKVAFLGKESGLPFIEMMARLFKLGRFDREEITFSITAEQMSWDEAAEPWNKVQKTDLSETQQALLERHAEALIQKAKEQLQAGQYDAMFLPGSLYNVPCGQAIAPAAEIARFAIEKYAIEAAFEKQVPILGVCNGALRMLVHEGARLEDVPAEYYEKHRKIGVVNREEIKDWLQRDFDRYIRFENDTNPFLSKRGTSRHDIEVQPGTIYAYICQTAQPNAGPISEVYSSHPQYCPETQVPPHVRVTAHALEDKIPEVFEWQNHSFALGVLFHPETAIDAPTTSAIIKTMHLFRQSQLKNPGITFKQFATQPREISAVL